MERICSLLMCAVICTAGAVNVSADILLGSSTKTTTQITLTSPDCIYLDGARMVKIAPYMKYKYGCEALWNAETKTVDFYYRSPNGLNDGHMRVKVGASYVNYSGGFSKAYFRANGIEKDEAYANMPNQVINGSVYVDASALSGFVMDNNVILKP